ncbi:hypothetical protein P5V15_008120 [Pogonomyrmex californicus]
MIGVCQKAQTETRGNKETSNILPISSRSLESPSSKSSIKYNDYNSETSATKIRNYNIPQRIHNVELKTEENFDIFNPSPKSTRLSPRRNVDDNVDGIIMKAEGLIEGRQKGSLNITSNSQLDKKFSSAITSPVQNEITEVDREYETYFFPPSISIEELTLQADKDYLHVMPFSARKDIEDSVLNFPNLPNILKTELTENSSKSNGERSKSKTRKSKMSSVYKMDSTMSKARKRKAKLRSSVSKSTITTKDTGFIGRKEAKRRRHKDHAHQQSNSPKHLKKFNDVVEIFHNTKLKNSNSGVSSKPSELNETKDAKKSHLPETDRKIQKTSYAERNNRERQSHDKNNEQDHFDCLQTLNCQLNKSNSGATLEATQEDKLEKCSNDPDPSTRDETQRCEPTFNRYDSISMPNYEMPTLASKLKRSTRSYFSRFNFRSIPFVVGTSVTPSYNLGLNIQQVLSVMKMRQPIASDVTPLLIRKVSRGVRPVSILLEQMNNHYEGSQTSRWFNNGQRLGQGKRESTLNLQHVGKVQGAYVPKTSIDTEIISKKDHHVSKQCKKKNICDQTKQQSSSAVNENTTPASIKNQRGISRMSLKVKRILAVCIIMHIMKYIDAAG